MKSFKLNLSVLAFAAIIALTPSTSSCSGLRVVVHGTKETMHRVAQLITACISKQTTGCAAVCEGKKMITEARALMAQVPQLPATEIEHSLRQEFYLCLNVICNQIDSVIGVIETKRCCLNTPAFINALQGPAHKLHADFMQALPIFTKIKAAASDEIKQIIAEIESQVATLQQQLASLGKMQCFSIIRNLQK